MSDLLSQLLEDYHARRSQGERLSPDDFRDKAGVEYPEFVELLAAESALDAAMEISPEPPLPRPFGAYTLLRELGRGAVGIVYEALHRDLGRNVALKVLRTGFDTTPDAIERFKREAVASAQVRHDHIVEVYAAGEVDGRPYYAMTLIEGQALSQLARSGNLPSPEEICGRMAGVADALHQLHEHGIIHRDLKPSNIMVEPSGRMVLADFGLARTVASKRLTLTGDTLGTPLYMSPEQLLGRREEINGRTDVYGLGATLYEVLAGQPVFKAEDIQDLMRSILEARPRPVRQVNPEVPVECEYIVMKAVEKRNDDRYETAGAMRDDLLAVSKGEAVSGRPVPTAVRALRRARRMWMPLAAAAALLIGSGLWYFARPATLEVGSFPVARVFLDGEELGTTPNSWEAPAGEHSLTLKSGGFVERTSRIRLRRGQLRTIDMVLIASDPKDPETLAALASQFELAMAHLEEIEKHRGAGGGIDVLPLYPRGEVRAEDLDRYRIDVGIEFESAGRLEFRMGETVLHSSQFDPGVLETVAPMPQSVLDGIKTGRTVTWGFFPEGKGKAVTARFKVVQVDLSRLLRSMEKRLKGQAPLVMRQLRAQLYLNNGLHYAAYREAAAVLETAEDCPQACAIVQHALQRMNLKGTPLWHDLDDTVTRLQTRPRKKRGQR